MECQVIHIRTHSHNNTHKRRKKDRKGKRGYFILYCFFCGLIQSKIHERYVYQTIIYSESLRFVERNVPITVCCCENAQVLEQQEPTTTRSIIFFFLLPDENNNNIPATAVYISRNGTHSCIVSFFISCASSECKTLILFLPKCSHHNVRFVRDDSKSWQRHVPRQIVNQVLLPIDDPLDVL